jgi:hypothetical protein
MSVTDAICDEIYLEAQRFRPCTSRVKSVWGRLNPQARAGRFKAAKACERQVLAVQQLIAEGTHESGAVKQLESSLHRSTYRNWSRRYVQYGFEGLIDCRVPQPPETVQPDVQQMVCALRRADPDFGSGQQQSH